MMSTYKKHGLYVGDDVQSLKRSASINTYTKACILIGISGLLIFASCKKVDNFKNTLDNLPQISNEIGYQYRPAYGVGDTLVITGRLNTKKDLKIMVGGVDAPVVKVDSVKYLVTNRTELPTYAMLDRVSVIISESMGIGEDRPITINSAGNTIQGATIEIYRLGGNGSFDKPLKITNIVAATSRQNVYLHCINGKGDMYYFDFNDRGVYHVKKDGTIELMLNASQLSTDQNGHFDINAFISGGVNPQGTTAWFSVNTGSGFRFCRADLATGNVTTLNTSIAIAAPYEGNITGLQTIVSGVYPDSKGNVYVLIGNSIKAFDYNAVAIALYNNADNSLKYLFKTNNAIALGFNDMPGNSFPDDTREGGIHLRFMPEEGTLYLLSNRTINYNGEGAKIGGIRVYDLKDRKLIGDFASSNFTQDYTRYIGPFAAIKLIQDYNGDVFSAATNFGLMPMPGHKLQFLLYQQPLGNKAEFPKWLTIEFDSKHIYQYAPGPCQLGGNLFGPLNGGTSRVDEMLNYDEDGHLYMTANGRANLVKTALQ